MVRPGLSRKNTVLASGFQLGGVGLSWLDSFRVTRTDVDVLDYLRTLGQPCRLWLALGKGA